MSNGALAFSNLGDSATPTSGTANASTPVTNVQTQHIANKWRSTTATDFLQLAWASDQTIDTLMLAGLGSTFTAAGSVRLRLFNSGGGTLYDSTVQTGIVDPNYGYAIHLLTAGSFTTVRFAKWDFVSTGSFVEVGRAFAGVRTQFTYNFAPGASRLWMANTKKTKSRGGQTYVDRSTGKARVEDFTLGWIPEAERWSLHEALDIANGDHTDVLFVKDVASTNLGRDSIWGLCDQISPVTQPFNDGTLYSRSYRLEERL